MDAITPVELGNKYVRLRPTVKAHAVELAEIGRDASIWEYLAPEPFRSVADAEQWVATVLSRPEYAVTYSVFDTESGRLAGSTSFLDVNPQHGRLEIGSTWYGTQFQRTHVNTATKLAMLSHAFDTVQATRVHLQTDARNAASQRAIARIGGVKEGVLRQHKKYPSGFIRDTMVFSIVADEWPAVRENLNRMLAR